jgi:predicted ribosomally synthesized peptide with SipW-like signal peptide
VVLLCLSTIAGGTHAALTASTSNAGNSFSAGTVSLTDNDSGTAMFTVANWTPGTPETRCLQVTYTGTLDATVLRLHGTTTGALAPYVRLTVTRGTATAPTSGSCTGFQADTTDHRNLGAGVLFDGKLDTYPSSFDAGIPDPVAPWVPNRTVSYRFTAVLDAVNAAQGLGCTATFAWEARR